MSKFINFKALSSAQVIILGFAVMIGIGTILLMLPFAKAGEGSASFIEALFTATSASCVTGLVVQDTATYWSMFGKFVILLLIQVGGMGVVTMAIAIAMVSGKKIGLTQRNVMQAAIDAPRVQGIVKLTRFIIVTTLSIEGIGALFIYPSFLKEFGWLRAIPYSIFHSISAFCNAGFDLMGVREHYSSLTSFSANPVMNITIILLIVIGGIGFITWSDIATNKHKVKLYRMQTKVVLSMTVFLIASMTLYFYVFEFSGNEDGFLQSLFQAVTLRTAGFNTVDLSGISQTGLFLMILMMVTGGAPSSTAGGIKITTVAVLFASAWAVFKRKKDACLYNRRLSEAAIQQASAIMIIYATSFILGGIIISNVEDLPLLTCLFEAASAIGTVGLSLGITPHLHLISRIVIIILMYFGRVGGLTLIYAAFSDTYSIGRLPVEKITVG